MMEAMTHAARLNSEGVLLMNEGNVDSESARAFTEALSIIQSQLAHQQQHNLTSTSSSQHPKQYSSSSSSSRSSSPSIEFGETLPLKSSSSSSLFIFNRGIYFRFPSTTPTSSSTVTTINVSDLHVCSVAIIFNLALLYHKRGLIHHNDNCYRKADDLYRKITLILGYPSSSTSSPSSSSWERQQGQQRQSQSRHHQQLSTLSDSATILMVAAINNMSQIRYERGHYDLAEDGVRAISHILQITSSSSFDTSRADCISTTNISEFWNQIVLNVLLLKQPSNAPAA